MNRLFFLINSFWKWNGDRHQGKRHFCAIFSFLFLFTGNGRLDKVRSEMKWSLDNTLANCVRRHIHASARAYVCVSLTLRMWTRKMFPQNSLRSAVHTQPANTLTHVHIRSLYAIPHRHMRAHTTHTAENWERRRNEGKKNCRLCVVEERKTESQEESKARKKEKRRRPTNSCYVSGMSYYYYICNVNRNATNHTICFF